MIGEIKRHKIDYSYLAILAISFSLYFYFARHSASQLFVATLAFALVYIIWGVWHHARLRHLTGRIVLEYFLVACLGIVIVSTLLI
jgi:hypothetical protein